MDALTKILGAAVELFRHYGFKTITMDDIARRAGISKKTLYQHFANKTEVIKEGVNWYKGRLFESCMQSIEGAQNAIEAMVRIMNTFELVYKHTNPMAIMELQRFYPEAYETFREKLVSEDVQIIKQNILRGIGEGLYREDVNAELMAKFRIETSLLTFQPNLLINDQLDLRYVSHEIAEHFLYGIMTTKGEKLYQKYKEKYQQQASSI